jgi:hypothetical protein
MLSVRFWDIRGSALTETVSLKEVIARDFVRLQTILRELEEEGKSE